MIRRLSYQSVRAVDLLVALWLVLCLFVGVSVGRRVNSLGVLGDGLVNVGEAISNTAAGLDDLSDVPLVGGGIAAIAEQIDRIGDAAVERGEEGKAAVLRLAVGIGVLFFLVPSLPVLVVWGPIRLLWERDRREVRRELDGDGEGIRAFLAHRAAGNYSYRRLATVSGDPWRDLRDGRYEALASLELDRLGLRAGKADSDIGEVMG